MDRIPGAEHAANCLAMLVREFGHLVEPTRLVAHGSPAWRDQHDRRGDIPERLARQAAEQAILTCATMTEVARSLAALYGTSDEGGLTIGHLPLVRSIMEGAGQVTWLINGDGLGTLPDMRPEATRERAVRAALLWERCLKVAVGDFKAQQLSDHEAHAQALLDGWRTDMTAALGPSVKGATAGIKFPSLTDMAKQGTRFAWMTWPAGREPIHVYAYMSSVAHSRLYQLLPELTAEGATHIDFHVAPVPLEVTASGVAAAWAVLRAFELTAVYVGWPTDGFGGIAGWLHGLDAYVADRTGPEAPE